MNGTGKTSFSPKQTVSWAQAVAIAVRIHAACNDGEIAETGGAWYEPYIAYATEAKLLPSTCPDGSAVTAKTITRAGAGGPVCECAARRGSCPRSTTRPSRI